MMSNDPFLRTAGLCVAMAVGVLACGAGRDDAAKTEGELNAQNAKGANPPSEGHDKLKKGAVVLQARPWAGGPWGDVSSVNAWFEDGVNPPNPETCNKLQEGNCTFSDCTTEHVERKPLPAASAGAITITGARFAEKGVPPSEGLRLLPNHENRYPNWHVDQLYWIGREEVHVQAKGGASVPAFDAFFKAPAIVDITTPTWDDGKGLTVDRTKDFDLTWSHAAEAYGNLRAELNTRSIQWPVARVTRVSCVFPVESRHGQIPFTMLKLLDRTDDGRFVAEVREESVIRKDDWHITVSLNTTPTRAKMSGVSSAVVHLE